MAYELAARTRNEATRKSFGNPLVTPSLRSSRPAQMRTSLWATSKARFPALLALRGRDTPFRRNNAFAAL